ncbi:hypothetical protein Tco_0222968 [Tanacetum coccineum]
MVISSPCLIDNKELTSPEQTAPGKDLSNPLIVDSLLKTIWSSMHHVFTMKHWLVQSKRLLMLLNLPLHLQESHPHLPTMLDVTEPSTSPSRITSSPSHSPEHSPTPEHITAAPTQPSPTQPSPGAEHHLPTPNESPIHAVHSHGSDEGRLKLNELTDLVTKLFDRIGVLEEDLKTTKQTYSSAFTKLILRGRILSDAEVQEKASNETEPVIQDVTPTEVIQDQESSEKGSAKVSTAGAKKGTASEEVPIVSTAEVNLSTAGGTVTYSRRSEEQRKRKDKGKAIMTESEPKKKSKKELEQERLSFAEAIRLEEQMNEEQRAQIARDEEIARQWDEEERQRAMSEAKTSKKIDWNDPSVRYHTLKMKPKTVAQARRNMIKYLKNQGNYKISDFKGMSYNEIRPIFEKVWDFNQQIEPMDSEHGSEIMKSPEKMKSAKKIKEEDVATQKEMKEVSKGSGAKRKKSIPRKSTRKRQKMEEDAEKEELKGFLDIIPREEVPIEDVEELYRLVKEGFIVLPRPERKGSKTEDLIQKKLMNLKDIHSLGEDCRKSYNAGLVKAADLEISMHGDYYGMFVTDPER